MAVVIEQVLHEQTDTNKIFQVMFFFSQYPNGTRKALTPPFHYSTTGLPGITQFFTVRTQADSFQWFQNFPYHKDFYCTCNIIRWENLVNNSCLYVTSAIKAILGKDKTRHGKQMAKKHNSIPSPSFQYQPSVLSP